MWKQAIELLGLGSAAGFAATTYGIFHVLDKAASDAAKSAISQWLHRNIISRDEFQRIILGLFDRLYGSPLLSVRTFLRSSIISLLVWFSAAIFATEMTGEMWHRLSAILSNITTKSTYLAILVTLFRNVTSDYICLFPIKKYLSDSSGHSLLSIVGFPVLITVIVVLIMNALITIVYDIAMGYTIEESLRFPIIIYEHYLELQESPDSYIMLFSAMLVMLWLPLFALSIGIIRIIGALLRAALWIEWFVKRGNEHPLRVVGVVAAALVFVVVSAGQLPR